MRVSASLTADVSRAHDTAQHPLAKFLPGLDASKLAGVDLFDARRALQAMTPNDRMVALATPVASSGLNPLLHAVAIGAPQLAALFAGYGASFASSSDEGLNVVQIALRFLRLPTATWLMNEPRVREALTVRQVRHTPDEIRALVASATQHGGPAQLDAVASALTAKPVDFFQHTDELILYISHANSLKQTRIRKNVQGWTASSHLCMRVRSLVSFYAAQTTPELRERVIAEIACTLDALSADRRMFAIAHTKDRDVRAQALELELDSMMADIGSLANRPEHYRTHVMPLTTPGHAAYLSIDATDTTLVVHVDNRIEGARLHVTEGPDVYPIAFEVPNDDAGRAALRATLREIYALAADQGMDEVYRALDGRLASLMLQFGVDSVHDPRGREYVAVHQLAGNCTYTSFVPGSQRRLGLELSQQFRAHETEDALQQHLRSFVEQPLREDIEAQRAEVAHVLSRSRARDTV